MFSPCIQKNEILSPLVNSEDINESRCPSAKKDIKGNLDIKDLKCLSPNHLLLNDIDDTMNSHNVSNVEEFLNDHESSHNRL